MFDTILEALLDTLKTVPFLFIAYILIEIVEHRSSDKLKKELANINHIGPIIGGIFGIIPQCGFSVAAANLYTERVITPGTLVAVFIATSDEAIPVLLVHPSFANELLKLIVIKMIFAIVSGFLTDKLLIKLFTIKKNHNLHEHCEVEENSGILKSALLHTAEVGLYILIINLVLSIFIEFAGVGIVSKIMLNGTVFQPFLTSLIGFIPNCAASVLLTELFTDGTLSFGALVSGLSTGAGIGLAVLFRNNKNLKENFSFVLVIYILSSLCGILIDCLPV